ncbi:hypothetical protein BDA96_07G175900 [Sorghum bicolor]|uniref:Uncharacterized protein n=1 Tax=Sorghum bicolor TaxID=4558 RepID=A0A921QPN0_SORBI|nr:hypothetical protein BDA96_07G175900 [Sorghum bicolor]
MGKKNSHTLTLMSICYAGYYRHCNKIIWLSTFILLYQKATVQVYSSSRFPAIVAKTATAQWNKSFWIHPCPVGASLQCRRRVHRGWRESSGLRGDVEVGSSSCFPWRWLSSTASSDSRPSLLGAWPRSMCVLRCLYSFVWMSFYRGSAQSLYAMERSRI